MTRHDFSYREGNAVCVQLAPPHSSAPLASPAETGQCSQQLSSLINASILVVLSCPWAGRSPAWLHPTISRYRDTLAYDITMQFFLTIRALDKTWIRISMVFVKVDHVWQTYWHFWTKQLEPLIQTIVRMWFSWTLPKLLTRYLTAD